MRLLRWWILVLLLDGYVALILTVKAFAVALPEPPAPATLGIALVTKLPEIITAIVGLVGAVTGVWTLIRAGQIKKDVNSQFSAVKSELAQAKAENAAIRQTIAEAPGATREEQVRAMVAKEQQAKATALEVAKPAP